MAAQDKILIIEDDNRITSFISVLLKNAGFDVLTAESGNSAISLAASHMPKLILLDLGLPDMDGMEVLSKIREWSDMPIIVVSARLNEKDKVEALDNGAHDYITKPFGNDELLARIRTAIRIHENSSGPTPIKTYVNRGLSIDFEKRLIKVDGETVHLTPLEYKILQILANNEGKVLTHEYLIQTLWGPYTHDSQLLRVNIANIRRKIEDNPADPTYILTEIGIGYRMAEEDS